MFRGFKESKCNPVLLFIKNHEKLFFCSQIWKSRKQEMGQTSKFLLSKFDINHEKTTDDKTQVRMLLYVRDADTQSKKSPKHPSDISIPEPGRNIFDLLS